MDEKAKISEPINEIVIDFGDICRFCLEDTNNAVRISDNCFSEDRKDLTIGEFVEKLTTIQIVDVNGFPSLVCERCVSIMKTCYDFITVCSRSQNELEKCYIATLEETKAELISNEDSNIVIDEFPLEVKKEVEEVLSIHNYSEKQKPVSHVKEIFLSENEDCLESYCDISNDGCKTTKPVDKKTQEKKSPYQCQFCDKSYIFKNSLVSHVKKNHFDRLNEKCNYCPKTFTSRPDLNLHLEAEHKNLQVLCPYCSLSLKVQSLDDHCREFHKLKMQFTPPIKLIVKETSTKGHSCRTCGKVLQTRRSYINHQKLHTQCKRIVPEVVIQKPEEEKERKIFNCHLCEKSFKGKDTLNRHIRTHTGEKSFICEICSKGFYTKSEISRHVRYHRKDYRYVCDICLKGFVDKTRFRHHIMAHKNVRPHKCPICDKEFILKGKMKIHMARRHSTKIEYKNTPKGQVDEASYIPLHELLNC